LVEANCLDATKAGITVRLRNERPSAPVLRLFEPQALVQLTPWMHCPSAQIFNSSIRTACFWQCRTNVWRGVASPARRAKLLRSEKVGARWLAAAPRGS